MIFRRQNRRDIDAARRMQDALARRALANAAAQVEQPRPAPWRGPSREDEIDLELAFIGAVLKFALVVAPRFSIGNPRAPQQPRNDPEAKTNAPKAAEPAAELKAVGA